MTYRYRNPARLILMAISLATLIAIAPAAIAAWSAGGTGSASGMAYVMPPGNTPIAGVSGSSVTLRWATAVFPDNHAVAGYAVRRFDAANGTQATVSSNCSGTVTTTTCTESNVPPGRWVYTVSTVQNNWTGNQSPGSAVVSVP